LRGQADGAQYRQVSQALGIHAATAAQEWLLRAHHSKALRNWLKESEGKIALFYLPSYSPELNPDELLNADLTQRVTKAAPARTKTVSMRTAVGALRSIQKQPSRVEPSHTATYAMPPRGIVSGPDQ